MDDNQLRPQASPYGLPLPGMQRRTVVTWLLLAINLAVWVAMDRSGGSENEDVLLRFGALFGPFIANGEYWRLFTAMFLHIGFMHLLSNAIALIIFGGLMERIFGHYRFTSIYVLAGLSGSLASYTFNPVVIGAGASGAIFGVLGALTAFFLIRRDVLGNVGRQYLSALGLIGGINLFFGFIIPGIDNWAHLGGLVGGFLLGLALSPRYRREALGEGAAVSTEAALKIHTFRMIKQKRKQCFAFLFRQVVNLFCEFPVNKQYRSSRVPMFAHNRVVILRPTSGGISVLKFKQVPKSFLPRVQGR